MNYNKRNFIHAEEEYFSVDDILSTNERVPCRFELPVHKFGFLDPSSESPDLTQGTKLELPLWLIQALHSRHIVSVEMPKVYREAYREILNADANVVDLHKMGPYFYHFGLYLLRFPHHDAEDISKILNQTFRNRFRRLMDSSHNSLDEDIPSVTSQLDSTELVLFNLGQKSLHDLKCWQSRKLQRIATSDLVVSHKKRKRAILESSET